MPSFDTVSELNSHEVANAVDQANRELGQRFDFKDSGAVFELEDFTVKMRVTGKSRDDLQSAIQLLRASKVEMPLQFNNFRD
jgi:uncharacterized protein YajQ (UPF0234 family)